MPRFLRISLVQANALAEVKSVAINTMIFVFISQSPILLSMYYYFTYLKLKRNLKCG